MRPPKGVDLLAAIEHASETFERDLDIHKFVLSPPTKIRVADLQQYDDVAAWQEWGRGDLVNLTNAERAAELRSFRGSSFAQMAERWIAGEEPAPIVIVETKDGTVIGDGRGRTSVAIGMDWPTINAVFLREAPKAKKGHVTLADLQRSNPASWRRLMR